MSRPPHLCNCGRVVAYGVRCECQRTATRERNARHDARRPSARERGYDAKWDRERAAYLYLHNTCRKCGREATTVDHIIPHRGDRSLFWNRSNWQPLCTSCHNSVKQRQERNR
ncbi:HNH endonuclease [Mesorhizobium sp. B2-2-4]|uniref:HNH endonuclease n=1 Tax=unclassified Mesorhizobium TaxID=325217 RepID=UPI00112BD8F3|nr:MULTISPECIES: HNH endonuclease signature motif containing protein [unclassified Mesorhizobium]TPM61098.1 HNH endonuclease [Mesorhizobium sp. B2-2-4]TPM70530.1 HNH endonuclease [Mesorhizobium sp. B2-2-1]TPN70382.1 HNH endonuclease [Mesorhizobium sp. B1-1-3]